MKPSELLDKPEKWTRDAIARDSEGREVSELSTDAACWCLVGALLRCDETRNVYPDAVKQIQKTLKRLEWENVRRAQ